VSDEQPSEPEAARSRLGEAVGLGLLTALVAGVPSAARAASHGASFLDGWLVSAAL